MNSLPKRRLGRGLAALIGDDAADEPATADTRYMRLIPIELVHPNPNNPRHHFDDETIDELAASIRAKGLLQPLMVRQRDTATYEIVAGERRWRAAQRAGIHEVPAIVRELSDGEALEIALIENIQRADLNPLEEARGYAQLMSEFAYTQQQLADSLGKSRSHIANLLRLLTLPEPVLDLVRAGKLSAGHARALVTATDPVALARQVVDRDLSVRQTEQLAKVVAQSPARRPAPMPKDADTRALEADLSANLRLRVSIDHKPGGQAGELRIRYGTLEELDGLCQLLSR